MEPLSLSLLFFDKKHEDCHIPLDGRVGSESRCCREVCLCSRRLERVFELHCQRLGGPLHCQERGTSCYSCAKGSATDSSRQKDRELEDGEDSLRTLQRSCTTSVRRAAV